MPVFTIETPAGQKLDIEAADQASAIRGAQQWHAENSQPKGLLSKAIDFIGNEGSALRQGAANVVGGTGETLNQYGPAGSGAGLKSAADAIAPKNYVSPSVIDKEGVHASALPQAVTEAAPGMAASIAAARVAPGGLWGKLLAGGGTYALTQLGNRAKERAAANTGDQNAVPTTSDKAVAAAAMLPEAAIGSIGLSRFLKGAGSVTNVGAAGLRDAAGQLAKTVAAEVGSGAGQDAAAQIGTTAGTPGGVSVDPYRVANAGVVQGATGGLMAAPRAAAEVAGARKYREFGGDNQAASTEVANEIQAAAGGGDNLTPGFVNAKTKESFHAVREVADATAVELARATSELKKTTPLTPAAEGVLSRAQKGEALTARDHEILDASLQNAPNGADVAALARKASVIAKLQDLGNFDTTKEKFTGGLAPKITGLISKNFGKAAALTALAEYTGSHIISQSPTGLAAVGGGIVGARILDKLTGNINPANRFAQRFADPNAPLRPQAGPPLAQPGPWGPIGPGPSGPQVPLAQQKPLAVPAGMAALLAAHVRQANRDSRFEDNQTKMQAMPLLRALAAQSKMQQQAAQPEAPVDPVIAQRAQMKEAVDLMNARRANANLGAQVTPEGPNAAQYHAADQANAAFDSRALRSQVKGAVDLTAARRANERLAQPDEEGTPAPVVTRVTKVDGKVKTQTTPSAPSSKPPAPASTAEPKASAGYSLSKSEDGYLLKPHGVAESEGANTTGVHFDIANGQVNVRGSFLPSDARGKGHGIKMYEELARIASDKGLPVASDYDISPEALGMYRKLQANGYNVEFAPGLHEGTASGFPGKFIPGEKDAFTVRVNPKPRADAPAEEAPLRASRTSVNEADNAIAAKALDSRLATGVPMHDSAAVNYRKSVAQRQALHRDRLIEVSGHEHFPSDNMSLMEALDKIRTEVKTPAELQAHVEDIATNHPEAAAIVRKFFGPKWANSIWHPTKKK